jgi:antitoxin FitA
MGDLLIRNLDNALKNRLRDEARQNGRSLSEEASVRLRQSLSSEGKDEEKSAGEILRAIVENSDAYWTEEELAVIEASRHEPDREPPRFDE